MLKLDCTLKDYIKLYESAVDINSLNTNIKSNKEYIAYITKQKGNPVKLCSYKNSFKLIPYDTSMFEFYKNNPLFWLIPLELPDFTIKGFIVRSFTQKVYRTIVFSDVSLPYGFYLFSDFKLGDPIFITEGTRDCMFLNTIYPYALSSNMGQISNDIITILKCLTDKVILVPDMDEKGLALFKINKNSLTKEGLLVYTLKYSLKDLGDYFYTNKNNHNLLVTQVQNILKII